MKTIKRILVLAIAAVAILVAWKVGSAELANYDLQEDLHQLASAQTSFRFGNVMHSDEDIREAVIHKAMDEGITLTPEQVTVQHVDDRPNEPLYLAAHYNVDVNVAQYSFELHFTPTSTTTSF